MDMLDFEAEQLYYDEPIEPYAKSELDAAATSYEDDPADASDEASCGKLFAPVIKTSPLIYEFFVEC